MQFSSGAVDTISDIGMSAGKHKTTLLDRFRAKVIPASKPVYGMSQICWNWVGAFDEKGRPRFKFQGRSANANRVRFMLAGQELGPDDFVVAICHQQDCVNPAHHVIGTAQDVRSVRNDYLHPGYQSLLRQAFKAGKIDIDYANRLH